MCILKSRFFGSCTGLVNEERYTILSEYFKYVLDFNFLQYMHVFRCVDSKNVIIVIMFNKLDSLYDCKGFVARRSNLPYSFSGHELEVTNPYTGHVFPNVNPSTKP